MRRKAALLVSFALSFSAFAGCMHAARAPDNDTEAPIAPARSNRLSDVAPNASVVEPYKAPPTTKGEKGEPVTTSDGLVIEELVVGQGAAIETGNEEVTVHYTGWLRDGKEFDSSRMRGPFTARIGRGQLIKGWDKGMKGMRVGGTRKLTIPPGLAYGERGSPPTIPPGSTLVFEIELLGVRP